MEAKIKIVLKDLFYCEVMAREEGVLVARIIDWHRENLHNRPLPELLIDVQDKFITSAFLNPVMCAILRMYDPFRTDTYKYHFLNISNMDLNQIRQTVQIIIDKATKPILDKWKKGLFPVFINSDSKSSSYFLPNGEMFKNEMGQAWGGSENPFINTCKHYDPVTGETLHTFATNFKFDLKERT